MGRGTKGKALYYHFVTLTNSASEQGQVYRCCTCTQGHYLFILSHEAFQTLLEGIHVRAKRNNPVRIEGFLYEAHLLAAHVSEAKINSLIHKIYVIILMIRFPHVVGNKKERKDFINLSQALCK